MPSRLPVWPIAMPHGVLERGEPEPVARPGRRAHQRKQAGREQTALEESAEEAREVGRGGDDRARGPRPRRARRAAVASGCEAADDAVVLARRVASRVAARDPRAGREAGAPELERCEDPAAQLALQSRPGRAFDDKAEQDVVRAGVDETLAGSSDRALVERDAHQLARRPPAARLAHASGAGRPRLPHSRRARTYARAALAR